MGGFGFLSRTPGVREPSSDKDVGADPGELLTLHLGGHLWTIVRSKVVGEPSLQHDIRQDLRHIETPQPSRHLDGQTFPRDIGRASINPC